MALIATIPAIVLLTLALVQFALAGYSGLAAAGAARAAARASYAGSDPDAAARAALPGILRDAARVRRRDDRAEVTVTAPEALPLLPAIPVSASAYLGPEGGAGG